MALHWKIIIGLVLGVFWALLSSYFGFSEFTLNWINPFGVIFINLLKLIAIPLILFSIIKGISDLSDIKKLGNLGLKTFSLYIFSTIAAISVGLLLVNIIKPGQFIDKETRVLNRLKYELWANNTKGVEIFDNQHFLNNSEYSSLLNSIQATDEESEKYLSENVKNASDFKNESPLKILIDIVPNNIFNALSGNGYMLQVIFFAIFFGVVLLSVDKNKTTIIQQLVDGFNEVFMKMVEVVMKAAPFFVFCLLAGKISELAGNNPLQVIQLFKGLGIYSMVVISGLSVFVFLIYPLVGSFFIKDTTFKSFFKSISKAQMLAFSTSSSAATLPVTMECVQNNLKVPKEISSFVLPIGATVNMDGTSLYISVAVVFLAQFHMIDLSIYQQLTIVLTASLASIGAAAVPSAGLIMMIMVLQSVGLNPAWIAIIFPVDRILDMCRTVVNVTGDATIAGIVGNPK